MDVFQDRIIVMHRRKHSNKHDVILHYFIVIHVKIFRFVFGHTHKHKKSDTPYLSVFTLNAGKYGPE